MLGLHAGLFQTKLWRSAAYFERQEMKRIFRSRYAQKSCHTSLCVILVTSLQCMCKWWRPLLSDFYLEHASRSLEDWSLLMRILSMLCEFRKICKETCKDVCWTMCRIPWQVAILQKVQTDINTIKMLRSLCPILTLPCKLFLTSSQADNVHCLVRPTRLEDDDALQILFLPVSARPTTHLKVKSRICFDSSSVDTFGRISLVEPDLNLMCHWDCQL